MTPDGGGLAPHTVEGVAAPTRLGVAGGRRLFLLLGLGLAWVVPALVDPRLGFAMLAWDGLLLAAWVADLAQIPRPRQITVRRRWTAPAALSVASSVEITIGNAATRATHVSAIDSLPAPLCDEPPRMTVALPAGRSVTASYVVCPNRRGDVRLGDAFLRCQGPLRLAERWMRVPLEQTVRVYPNLDEAKRQSIYLVRSRQIAIEKRHSRLRGAGREFESLREYREGDEFRDICWTAAARRGKLVTRTYRVERSQTIWIVIDTGRLMRARVGTLAKLDHAVNAALSLAQVALGSGDRVGLLAYGRRLQHRVPAARGSHHLRGLIEQLADVREETTEADHLGAASRLLSDQKRRSLIVWLTDLAETAMTPEVIEAAGQMTPPHLVLFVAIGQPDLAALAAAEPRTVTEMYRAAAAQEVMHRRELLLARLRSRGVLALECDSGVLSPTLVNSYIAIKERNQL